MSFRFRFLSAILTSAVAAASCLACSPGSSQSAGGNVSTASVSTAVTGMANSTSAVTAASGSKLASIGRTPHSAHGTRGKTAPSRPAANPEATITTSMGVIKIELLPKSAPNTVENFIGLATGKKEWTDPNTGQPTHRPLYNGVTFHRVIPNFMIQGGDPLGTGMGGPGYQFNDEIDPHLGFDAPGYVAMANAGPNTNGSQFFITTAATPWLNGHYNIFGRVLSGQAVVDKISEVPTDPSSNKPLTPVVIQKITVSPAAGKR